ncbi:MAG: beta-ketoacyl-[acyl-carrier-protein] synthase II [Planctomycetaceae bacterium]|nr:beta-ketoacyl-[acyl-carrier-protein] synthase II [Planctomycetaceae bacterium]
MNPRIVITGLGCVTPLGNDVTTVWQRLIEGQSGAGAITLFDAQRFPVRIAAEVDDPPGPIGNFTDQQWQRQARQTRFAVAAADLAQQHANLPNHASVPTRTGVYLGCGEIFPDFNRFAQVTRQSLTNQQIAMSDFMKQGLSEFDAYDETVNDPGIATSLIAGLLNAQGPCINYTAACVSSSMAIGEAAAVIQRGEADTMLAGGAHSMIHPFGVSGFHRLSTLSTRNDSPAQAARPFEQDRDGFVIGEGGIVLVLENLETSRQRGAEVLAELTGYGATHDAFRITDPRPDGRAAARCISKALENAGLEPDQIDYINAHGSGTGANDRAETVAVRSALGAEATRIPISSTKSMTGHLTTACGALELLISVMALRTGVIPPTVNYEKPDPECDLDYVPNEARAKDCRNILSNSFGFGGQNVCLTVSRFEE